MSDHCTSHDKYDPDCIECLDAMAAKEESSLAPVSGSAFVEWFNKSSWAGAGKDAGELAKAAWCAALEHAADLANRHRQELFDDGLDCDLDEMDKKSIFLESMTQERDSIEYMLRAAAKTPNIVLGNHPHDSKPPK